MHILCDVKSELNSYIERRTTIKSKIYEIIFGVVKFSSRKVWIFFDKATDIFNINANYNLRIPETKAAIDKNVNNCKTVDA